MADASQDVPVPPEPGEGLDDTTLQVVVTELLTKAAQYIDEEISLERAKAADYYQQKPFGNEDEGRSQFVSADVRDSILQIMPDVLRVFHGPENTVEYQAGSAAEEAAAAQATDYANFIFRQDNPGFLITHDVLKDGFLKKLGIAKIWYEDKICSETYQLSGLSDEAYNMLQQEEGITISHVLRGEDGYHCSVTKDEYDGRIRVEAVPPEEFIFNRDARRKDGAICMAHRREQTLGQLAQIGINIDEAQEAAGAGTSQLEDNPERLSRETGVGSTLQDDDGETVDPSSHKVLYCEAYILVDRDGSGIPRLTKYHTIGDNYRLVGRTLPDGRYVGPEEGEPVDVQPFATYTPDPEPHALIGQSIADQTQDIQYTKSMVIRGMLNSLNQSLHPRTWAVMGQVEPTDLLNTEIGGIIRMRQPGMAGEFVHEFIGKEAFPVLGYFDEVKEARTGRSKASAGLDADALQSSTKAAVTATISAAQARSEMICRIFAETFMVDVFRLILRLVKAHQNKPRMVKLRNQFVEVDPRPWNAEMGVKVVVALGGGLTDEKIANLMGIAAKQEQILATLGPNNPLVSLAQYRNTLARITQLQGFRNDEEFFKPFTEQQAEQLARQAAAQPSEPSPEMMVAQAQAQAVQAELQIKQAELQMKQKELELKAQQQMFQQQLDQQKAEQEWLLKVKELELKYQQDINEFQLKQAIEGNKLALQAMAEKTKAEMTMAVESHKAELKAAVDTHKNELTAEVQREAAKHKPAPKES